MNITITKEEMKEIIRLYIIGMQCEEIIKEKTEEKENEEEIIKDQRNLLMKLEKIAIENSIDLKIIPEAFEEVKNNEEISFIEALIKRRKRTYTSNYWNFTDYENYT